MTEPISIVASAIGLASTIRQTALAVHSLAQDVRTFQDQIAKIESELESLLLVINRLKEMTEDGAFDGIDHNSTHVKDVLTSCAPTLVEIQELALRVRGSASKSRVHRLTTGLFWASTKRGFQELRSSLDSHKTTLLLALQMRNIELVASITDNRGQNKERTLAAAEKGLEIENSIYSTNRARTGLTSYPSSARSIVPCENQVNLLNHPSNKEISIPPAMGSGDTMRSQSRASSFWPTNPQPTEIEASRRSTQEGRRTVQNSAQRIEQAQLDEFQVSTHQNIGAWISTFSTTRQVPNGLP
ncbi:hypothetical protein NA56DRAFT_642428 [Hyaloscypha hepaticicola]|uniref:Azaphilone pigments biosynthesis cluster protein L N-terminal domain-containing protein n=1 Tax=Hyaloscypha hepaticicola TaxID=2082293 RepID=A0A2J6QGR4_9HELO|nr:hypothetical protein NA56DRAFT_642428 [Hyaloscypha hepaticicola]